MIIKIIYLQKNNTSIRLKAEKKQQLIREIQDYWNSLEKKRIKNVAERFQIALPTAKKYVEMSELEINSLNSPNNYKKRESPMNVWLNIIFKMMDDGHSNETIYFYILRQPCFHESKQQLGKYIYLIGKNNFPYRAPFNMKYLMEWVISSGVIVLKRTEILKYLLTCNPKVKKDEKVGMYIDMIKGKYPVASRVECIFKELRKDIAPVKNAISYSISSGFVEGNNNKFKLLKRIVYGRSGLVNLTKKCMCLISDNVRM